MENQRKEDYNKDCFLRVDVEQQSSDPVAIAVECAVAIVATSRALVSVTIFGGSALAVDACYFVRAAVAAAGDDGDGFGGDEDLSVPYVAVAAPCRGEGYGPRIQSSIFCTIDLGDGDDDGQEPEVRWMREEADRKREDDSDGVAEESEVREKGEVSVLTGEYELGADGDDD